MKLTDWYVGTIKPVHEGVYQRPSPWTGNITYSFWNGYFWCFFAPSIEEAAIQTEMSSFQDFAWRGVAK